MSTPPYDPPTEKHTPWSRDAALRRLTRSKRALLAGSAALTAVLAVTAASAFPGRTLKARRVGAQDVGGAARTPHSAPAPGAGETTAPLQAPRQSPESSPEAAPPSTPESAEGGSAGEGAPGGETSGGSSQASPSTEAPPPESTPPAGEAPPVEQAAPSEAPPASAGAPESPVLSGGS